MIARTSAILAAAMLLVPAAAVAQQAPEQKPQELSQPAAEQPTTTLASAADVRLPTEPAKMATEEPAKKKRNARVTTCRCGADADAVPR
jgi:hypothetical protein